MRIIELFAGIGACSTAIKRLGIKLEIVDAVEIDKYAMTSFNAIHSTNFEPQDITKWNKELKDIDIITHGSPCQDFSVAGKQAGGDIGSGTRSSLMYETIRIVGQIRPKYVLWENVKNLLSKKHKHNFDAYIETMNILGYNSYYQILNAKDYGIPQNRERVFTVSIRKNIDNGFKFPKPIELKLKLKDMLDDVVDEKYYLSDKTMSDFIIDTKNDIKMIGKLDIKGHDCVKRVYWVDGISPTLTDMQGGNRQPKIMTVGNYMPSNHDASRIIDKEGISPTVKENHGTVTAVAMRGRYNASGKVEQQIEMSSREIANSITTVQKDSMIGEEKLLIKNATKKGYDEATNGDSINLQYPDSRTRRGRVGHEVSQTLMANDSIGVVEGLRIRKLTPLECWRLMGFDDEDFYKAQSVPTSNTQLYKQAGNSIVVDVLVRIFRNLLEVN